MNCEICQCDLLESKKSKNDGVQYASKEKEAGKHISRHHLFPKRFQDFVNATFSDAEIKNIFGIDDKEKTITLCHDCHEVMIHNIILSPKIIKKLCKKMKGKDIRDRIILFYKELAR